MEYARIDDFIKEPKIAYFSMEIGVRSDMPTYSGGLGVLAGDTIKSAADMKLPVVAVTLLTKKGYFKQELDIYGRQTELPDELNPALFMSPLKERVSVFIEGREVQVGAWLYIVKSATSGRVPMIFLDADLPENAEQDRGITYHLYGETRTYKWVAEKIGNPKALRAVGQALKKNPLPIVLPCHRVIASDGSIGGFSCGVEIKKWLLRHESFDH